MKELLHALKYVWGQAGYAEMAGYVSAAIALFGGAAYVWKLVVLVYKRCQQRLLLRDLHPFYTKQEIQRATQYYVETKCQNVAPSKDDEPGRSHAFATKEKVIPFFLKKAFKADQDACQFYMVLADSGMGKTTFLINLYLRYIDQFFGAKYRVKLLPLGFPEIDKEIDTIPDEMKRDTILLLDAFDEDILAVDDYTSRLDDLIHKVIRFREVVMTCRTQFFPSEEEEPKETGVLRFGPEGGRRVFHKLYLSPFDDRDIRAYLRKRFAWFQIGKKRRARQIVACSPNLMVRPMLLSSIEDLLQRQRPYTLPYMVYAELIAKWVEREAGKVPHNRRKRYQSELFAFSRAIARNIYEQRERRQALVIPGQDIVPFADRHDINLKEMELKSRSLLNRNAQGQYKFSHKSILEYFLAEEAFFNAEFRGKLDFDGMDQAKAFLEQLIWDKLTVPFFSRSDLQGEYRINNGNPLPLQNIPLKHLPQITTLKLRTWDDSENALLFKGLQHLKELGLGMLTSTQLDELQQILPGIKIFLPLRSEPRKVSEAELRRECRLNENLRPHEYIQNDFVAQGEVVLDRATGLTWQQAGSSEILTYQWAASYVERLNRTRFAGYTDWRLPTMPELTSLLEPEELSNGLYLSPVFDKTQSWCWSADRQLKGEGSTESVWDVGFGSGYVNWNLILSRYYVRAVRS